MQGAAGPAWHRWRSESLMGLKKGLWKAENVSAGWIPPGGRGSLHYVLRGDGSFCFVSLFHIPEDMGCYFKWEGREKLSYIEWGWLQALRFWCPDEEDRWMFVLPCPSLHFDFHVEVHLLPGPHMVISWWDSLHGFFTKSF